MRRKVLAGLAVIFLIFAADVSQRALGRAAAPQSSTQVPLFEVDPTWPQLPNNWVLGVTAAVAVDSRASCLDHAPSPHRGTRPESGAARARVRRRRKVRKCMGRAGIRL